MSEPRRKTVVVPETIRKALAPLIAWASRGDASSDVRDWTKPIAYDEHGQPLYAPPGYLFTGRDFTDIASLFRTGTEDDGGPYE
jgi:hypothetical protein